MSESPGGAWIVRSRRSVFSGGPIREVAVETVELPDGRIIDDYYAIRMPDFSLVFAQMADGTVPMFRQYRHGAQRVCLTFPGGAIEDGESPLDAARRELLEELGCTSSHWMSYGAFTTNANQGCNRAHLFRADRCVRVRDPHSGDLEESAVVSFTVEDLIRAGRLEEIGLTSHAVLFLLATHPMAGLMRG